MRIDVRLIVVAALLLAGGCLTIGFIWSALIIRREHVARWRRIRLRLEDDATSIMSGLSDS
jgi:hypothetical protein